MTPNEMPPVGTKVVLTVRRDYVHEGCTTSEKGTIVDKWDPYVILRPYRERNRYQFDIADIISCKVGWTP